MDYLTLDYYYKGLPLEGLARICSFQDMYTP